MQRASCKSSFNELDVKFKFENLFGVMNSVEKFLEYIEELDWY
jgi:hypothetical protein